MKFAFKIVITCASFCFAFGQWSLNLWPDSYSNSYPNTYQNGYPYSNTYPNQRNRISENSINQETEPSTSLSLKSCESYWRLHDDNSGVWGQLSIVSPNRERAIIKVILTLAAALPTRYVGDIDLLKSKESTTNDVAYGLPIEYKVRFPLQHPIPQLTEIYYNSQLLCRGPKVVGEVVTTITLEHTYFTGLRNNDIYVPPQPPVTRPPATQPPIIQPPVTYRPITYQPETSRPRTQRPTTRRPPIVTRPTQSHTSLYEKINDLNLQCGVPQVNFKSTTSLVVNGKMALKGQFPWLAAYYHNDVGFSGFICGGSLVSTKIVITAAHCINDKTDTTFIRQPDQAIIYVGRHNLRNENERGYLFSGATKFIVHPDWQPKSDSYDGDIAAIVLLRTIQFTIFVQPLCLWDSTSNSADLINHSGIVAGFGKTQTSVAESSIPYWSELPVVDDRTCFESNSVFINLTSRRTFCGGNRDGSGPCNGDSGGGFIVKSDGKYYLRGIVSASLFNRENNMCDTTNYAVFTDVAAYKDWIYTQIDTYE